MKILDKQRLTILQHSLKVTTALYNLNKNTVRVFSFCKNSVFLILSLVFFVLVAEANQAPKKATHQEVEESFNLIFTDPAEAITVLTDLEERSKFQGDSLYGIVLNNIGVYHAVRSENDIALAYFERAIQALPKNKARQVKTLTNAAIVYKHQNQQSLSLNYLRKAMNIAEQLDSPSLLALVYGEMASVYKSLESYDIAIDYLVTSISYWERNEKENLEKIGVEKQKLGGLYFLEDKLDRANKFYNEAKEILRNSTKKDAYYLTILAQSDLYLHRQAYDTADLLLSQAEEGLLPFNNPIWNNYIWELKGRLLSETGDWISAKDVYLKSFEEAKKHDLSRFIYTVSDILNHAILHDDERFIDDLLVETYTDTFAERLESTTLGNKKMFYRSMTQLWEKKKDFKNAYVYSVKFREASEALTKSKNQQRLDELQTRYELRLFKRENELLTNLLRNERLKTVFGFGLLGIFLIGGVYTVRFFKLKVQSEKTERLRVAKINALREKELEQANTIIGLKDQFIKEKERELIDYAAERSRLSEEIKLIEQNILKKNNQALARGVERLKSFNQESHIVLLEKFRALNPVLQTNLSRPEFGLTRSEIEFCMLLSMRLTNKEIARTLSISPSSVATKKYRMLQKLSLDSNQDFDGWLRDQAETS